MTTFLRTILDSIVCKRRAVSSDSAFYLREHLSSQAYGTKSDDAKAVSSEATESTDTSGPEQVAESFDGSDTDNTEDMPMSEPSTGSTDGSDVETTYAPVKSKLNGFMMSQHHQKESSMRWNPQAMPFVPSATNSAQGQEIGQQSSPIFRGSIRSLISALEVWEASAAAEDFFSQEGCDAPQGHASSPTSMVLQQALSKLAPHDAAMIRAFVESKITQGVQSAMASAALPAFPSEQAASPEMSGLCAPPPLRSFHRLHKPPTRRKAQRPASLPLDAPSPTRISMRQRISRCAP